MKSTNSDVHVGLLLGGAVSAGVAGGIRAWTTGLDRWALAIGLGSGILVGLAMLLAGKKNLALYAVEGAVLASGPRLVEEVVTGNFSGVYDSEKLVGSLGPGREVEVLGLTTANEETFGNTTATFGAVPVAGVQ